jgi:HlyD family secretion protein
MRRLILIAVTTALALVVALLLWRPGSGEKTPPYITLPLTKGNITQTVSATGTIQAVTTVQVGSQVSGTIATLYADFNSRVKKGEVIAQLEQAKFKARVEEERANVIAAKAQLAKVKVSLEDAARTRDRARQLRSRDLISQSELDAAETAYDATVAQLEVARAQVAQAEATLSRAALDLADSTIRSPVDGIVISRNVDVGQTVAASLQAPTLFTIAQDLAKMEVHTNVAEADVGNVWVDQDVVFTVDAHPARRFQGKVSQVRHAPNIVQNVVTYDAVVAIDNKEHLLRPGMTANVEFLVKEKEGVLRLPNAALRFRPPQAPADAEAAARQSLARGPGGGGQGRRSGPGGERGGDGGDRRRGREGLGQDGRSGGRSARVYTLKGQEIAPARVRLGITDGTHTEVMEGELTEEDRVVIAMVEKGGGANRSTFSNLFGVRGFGFFR